MIQAVHHIAIIAGNYEKSKQFYIGILGLKPVREVYREQRKSWKLDLALNDQYIIELFSFPDAPARTSRPEAKGLRHLAFSVIDLEKTINSLNDKGVICEPIRTDEYTGKRFSFFQDPDGLPLELYEQ
jgi:glyoxylase I family protein